MVTIIICSIIIFLNLFSHSKTQDIYISEMGNVIIDLKKDFLKDTVNNLFLEIDRLRETKYNNYKRNVDSRLRRFQDELDLNDEDFIQFYINRFEDDSNTGMWTAFLWDDETDKVLYDSNSLYHKTIDNTLENFKLSMSSYALIEKESIKGVFGVSKSYIDEIVKTEIGDLIKSRKFSNDSYIWVNEVINYEGGKNYAIRRIHPNLIDTEGKFLSTDMKDIKGNLPYLEELDGIKENGELFFTYFFKKLNNQQISEKITYAKLYKDFDWIIAMGVHLDEIAIYTEQVKGEIHYLSSELIIRLIVYLLLAFLLGFTVLYVLQKRYLLSSTKELENEVNMDTLTRAASRRYGEISLDSLFKKFKLTKENPAIMMFDIDDFKHVNDNYGHKIGDIVLIEIVKKINSIIRSSDQLIRWGGDEFVGILPGLREEHIEDFSKKILEEVSSLKILAKDKTVTVTISLGFSYFKDADIDYNDVLKRADDAMYISKEQGKNRANIVI